MPVTYSSSLGSSYSISSGGGSADEPATVVTETQELGAEMGDLPVNPGGATAVSAAVDAAAYGEDTYASGSADVSIIDTGGTTATSIDLEAYAAAQALNELAYTTADVSGGYIGAGTYISISQSGAYFESNSAGGSASVSTSSLSIDVIDLTGSQGSGSNVPAAPPEANQPEAVTDGFADLPPDAGNVAIDGNLAVFDVQVFAAGENSYADAVVDVFAVEDALSVVTIVVDAGVL